MLICPDMWKMETRVYHEDQHCTKNNFHEIKKFLFLQGTLVLTSYIDVVLTLSIAIWVRWHFVKWFQGNIPPQLFPQKILLRWCVCGGKIIISVFLCEVFVCESKKIKVSRLAVGQIHYWTQYSHSFVFDCIIVDIKSITSGFMKQIIDILCNYVPQKTMRFIWSLMDALIANNLCLWNSHFKLVMCTMRISPFFWNRWCQILWRE